MEEFRPQDDEPRFFLVGNIAAGRARMDFREIGTGAGFFSKSLDDLVRNLVIGKLASAVVGQPGNRGLR